MNSTTGANSPVSDIPDELDIIAFDRNVVERHRLRTQTRLRRRDDLVLLAEADELPTAEPDQHQHGAGRGE